MLKLPVDSTSEGDSSNNRSKQGRECGGHQGQGCGWRPNEDNNITTKEDQKTQQKVMDKETRDQGMINQTLNVIFVISFGHFASEGRALRNNRVEEKENYIEDRVKNLPPC